jgi:hypothetical protein
MAPVSEEKVPAAQLMHDVAPVLDWYWPAEQLTHADDAAAPVETEKVPEPQLTHVEPPVPAW